MSTNQDQPASPKRAPTGRKRTAKHQLRIGIMGSGANPWGTSHLVLAEQSREQAELDFVLLMPVGQPVDKRVEDNELRWAFTQAAAQGNPGFVPCREELDRDGPSYMVDTLRSLRRKYRRAKFFLIVGEDRAEDLVNWRQAHIIVRMATVLCGPRYAGSTKVDDAWLQKVLPKNARYQAIEIEYSMTWVRKRLAMGKSVRYMVPDSVLEVIKAHNAYGPVNTPATGN